MLFPRWQDEGSLQQLACESENKLCWMQNHNDYYLKKLVALVLYVPATLHFSVHLFKPIMILSSHIIVLFIIWHYHCLSFWNLCLPVSYALREAQECKAKAEYFNFHKCFKNKYVFLYMSYCSEGQQHQVLWCKSFPWFKDFPDSWSLC